MTFDYAEIAALANELLADFGQTLAITTHVAGEYNPATGTSSSSVTSHEGFGMVMDYGLHGSGISNSPDSLIQQGDKQLLLAPGLVTPPMLGDVVTFDGADYKINNVKTISPAGVCVLYDCNVRR